MQPKTLIGLALATGAVIAAAGVTLTGNAPVRTEAQAGGPLFPDLIKEVNAVDGIDLFGSGTAATLTRGGGGWTVVQKDGYPADADLVKSTVVGLAQARTVEPRTALPDLYDRIGVQDPETAGATSVRVTLKAGERQTAALIVGKEASAGRGGRDAAVYVRKPGEAQSWMVETPMGRIEADPMRWVDRTTPRLPRERLKSVEIRQPNGGTVTLKRDDPAVKDFIAAGLPQGTTAKPSYVETTTGAFGYLSFEDVRKADPAWFASPTIAVFRSFDGVVLTVRQTRRDTGRWITLEAAFDAEAAKGASQFSASALLKPEEVEAQVKDWNARHTGWTYRVYDALGEDLSRTGMGFVDKD